MKRTIIMSAVAVSLISSSVFAYGNMGRMSQDKNHEVMHKMMMKKKSVHSLSRHFMHLVFKLNLSKEQVDTITKIIYEDKPKKKMLYSAFNENGFDKEKFITQMKQQRENMLKSKAEKIDNIYNVLTKKQKSQLRVLMDLQEGKG